MGLDAVVYKSARQVRIPATRDGRGIRVDKDTGEVYSEGQQPVSLSRQDVIAVKKRLGNISLIAALREEVARVLKNDDSSLVLNRVLYDGTHSGDVIEQDILDLLKKELSCLKMQDTQQSRELIEFIFDMEELIAAAEEQGNPIVFT
jgi:hypothetical protein